LLPISAIGVLIILYGILSYLKNLARGLGLYSATIGSIVHTPTFNPVSEVLLKFYKITAVAIDIGPPETATKIFFELSSKFKFLIASFTDYLICLLTKIRV